MYNTEIPGKAELPSTVQLIKSTIIAIIAAGVILVAFVLPSEYGIDPTGIGSATGLKEMGEIKEDLAREAEEDRLRGLQQNPGTPQSGIQQPEPRILAFLFRPAFAQNTSGQWTDELRLPLEPGQGVEIKLVMKKGGKVEYSWRSDNGRANYDLHGDGSGQKTSYKKGRGVEGDTGILEASFDGNHGWFWRNRDKQPITIILRVRGDYSEIKKYL
jgi:hypothetical protein